LQKNFTKNLVQIAVIQRFHLLAISEAINKDESTGQGVRGMKLKAFWQIVCRNFAQIVRVFEYFYHVHILLQSGIWPLSGSNGINENVQKYA